MSIRNAGSTIREARFKAGLTLERLSENICTTQALCRIEKGQSGVSPNTFYALMERAGFPCSVYPIFQNWNDYKCFSHINHAKFHLNAWQLDLANDELEKIEALNWNKNRFYYQEWLLLEAQLQFRSYSCNHQELFELLQEALHITKPNIDFNSLLSITELEILIALAQEALYLNKLELCLSICSQAERYLANCSFTYIEKDLLMAKYAICFSKYLIAKKDYKTALSLANEYRHKMVTNGNDGPLLELNFLTALAHYHTGNLQIFIRMFKDTYYSAHAIKSVYATVCLQYLKDQLHISIQDDLLPLPEYTIHFPIKKTIDISAFTDGIYDLNDIETLNIGKFIQELRIQQTISQQVLCQGLCSKSKLSKIENGTLQPDVILAETLLQRLGLSEREFTFWGSQENYLSNHLKHKLFHENYLSNSEKELFLGELRKMDLEKNSMYKQVYLFFQAMQDPDIQTRLQTLLDALSLTLPDFDYYKMNQYRLSCLELAILNNIAYAYRYTETPLHGIELSRKILDYQKLVHIDILNQAHFFPYTLYQYARTLYVQDNHKELIHLFRQTDTTILRYNLNYLGGFFFYLSQSYGNCNQTDLLSTYAIFSSSLQNMYEHFKNASTLLEDIEKEFSIHIVY